MKIKGHPNLEKNNFGVVINTNKEDYNKYIETKKMRYRINNIESDINNIKDMLTQLINKES
jgi:hypothetical protein